MVRHKNVVGWVDRVRLEAKAVLRYAAASDNRAGSMRRSAVAEQHSLASHQPPTACCASPSPGSTHPPAATVRGQLLGTHPTRRSSYISLA